MTEEEENLIKIAELHRDDKVANAAMKKLREDYDRSYMWCNDCDGMVVKQSECCMNQVFKPLENDFDF